MPLRAASVIYEATVEQRLTFGQRIRALITGSVTVPEPPKPAAPAVKRTPLCPQGAHFLIEWKRNPHYVEYSKSLLAEPKFRELLAILANMRTIERDPSQAALYLGQRQGFDAVITAIMSSAEFEDSNDQEVEADYGAGDVDLLRKD